MSLTRTPLPTLARVLAKADASHAGKLALRPVTRKDGKITHHWMLPPGDGPTFKPVMRYDRPETEGHDKLEAALARPEIQAFLARTLNLADRPPLSVDDFIHLCGLPPGCELVIKNLYVPAHDHPETMWFSIMAHHPELHIEQAAYTVRVNNYGPSKNNPNPEPLAYVELDAMEMKPGHTGSGLGTKMLLAQVKEMQRLGFTHIELEALRTRPHYANGYYTWMALGFDARMPRHDTLGKIRREYRELNGGYSLPAKLKTVQQLLRLPHGREIWKKHGITTVAKFDTRPGSPSVAFLEAYATEKHYV